MGSRNSFCAALGPLYVSGEYKPYWSKSGPKSGVQDKVTAPETVQDTVRAVPSTEPYRTYRYIQPVSYQIRRSLINLHVTMPRVKNPVAAPEIVQDTLIVPYAVPYRTCRYLQAVPYKMRRSDFGQDSYSDSLKHV